MEPLQWIPRSLAFPGVLLLRGARDCLSGHGRQYPPPLNKHFGRQLLALREDGRVIGSACKI